MNGGEAITSRHIILIIIMSKFVYPFIDMDWYALLLYLSICNDYSIDDFLSMDYSAVGSAGMAVVSAGCDMMLSVGTSIVSLVSDSMLSVSIDAKICRRSSSGMAYFDDVVKDTISLPS